MGFQSTLSLRRATRARLQAGWEDFKFQSTLSLRRATRAGPPWSPPPGYFNPRSPCGERPDAAAALTGRSNFNPRSPCGERLQLIQTEGQMIEISIHALLAESDPRARLRIPPQPIFQSTLSLRRATWVRGFRCWFRILISIHALLAESDARLNHRIGIHRDFNPRSPCGERPGFAISCIFGSVFQSTLSLRRATLHKQHRRGWLEFQSTLSLRRATVMRTINVNFRGFQSTLSLRRATRLWGNQTPDHWISIHALLAESDQGVAEGITSQSDFNPRSPCGERPAIRSSLRTEFRFQSTLSLRRATFGSLS